jgi:predicted lipase
MEKPQIMKLLNQAALAYLDDQPVYPGEKVIFVDCPTTGLQFFMRYVGDTMLIAFRGSNSHIDWVGNFEFWKKKVPYGNADSPVRVHAGFIDDYKSDEVRTFIHSKLTSSIHRVQITGHSLGAAMAILCAVDLQYNFPNKDIEVAVFGCPRVGNSAFRESYNKRVFKTMRVENGNDIVTKVPPAIMGFRHVGIRVHVGPPRLLGIVSPEAHRPQHYMEHLWQSTGG